MRNEPIETFECNGYKVEIHKDEDPMNPCVDWDNTAILASWHPRYILGSKQIKHMTEEEIREEYPNILALLPLYLYDHSGITMNTTGFGCGFDSGQVGWGIITRESAEKMGFTDLSEENMKEVIVSEVKTYDYYLTGQVFGYRILNVEGDETDSSWGFVGSMSDAKEAAREHASGMNPCYPAFMSLREFLLLKDPTDREPKRSALRGSDNAESFLTWYDTAKESWEKFGPNGPPVGSKVETLEDGHGGPKGRIRTLEGVYESDERFFAISREDNGDKRISLVCRETWFVSMKVSE